jgi:thioredoxin reductase (NADPH)
MASGADLDCLIIGGGPAGLAAAIYLARFRRRALVIDAGFSRAALIPKSRNFPGFPDGISGVDILSRMKAHAGRYGARVEHATVSGLARQDDVFVASVGGQSIVTNRVILATGVIDNLPEFDGVKEHIAGGRIRVCPVCDAFEVSDKPVAVYGPASHVGPKALFLHRYTRDLTLLCTDDVAFPPEMADKLRHAGIALPAGRVVALNGDGEQMVARFEGGAEKRFATIYAAMGSRPRSELYDQLGGGLTKQGCIDTDEHQRTSISGVWAIGDVVDALDQMAVAIGHAAIAATNLHNSFDDPAK